jgi:hypothetical protein
MTRSALAALEALELPPEELAAARLARPRRR